jgi:hypothetical protein
VVLAIRSGYFAYLPLLCLLNLTPAEATSLLAPTVTVNINSADIGDRSFSSPDVLSCKHRGQNRNGILLGLRAYDVGLSQRYIAKLRLVLDTNIAKARLSQAAYMKHREWKLFQKHPAVFLEHCELFMTQEEVVVTEAQLLNGQHIICVEPQRWLCEVEKGHRSRRFDRFLTPAVRNLVGNEWFYWSAFVIAVGSRWELDYELVPEHTTMSYYSSLQTVKFYVRRYALPGYAPT